MAQCYLCEKGELKKKKIRYTLYGEHIGDFSGELCESCDETFFSEDTSRKITAVTKEKGLWGIGGRTKIGQAGSTLDVRLPRKIIDFLHLKKGQEVTISAESRRKLIIEL